MWYHAKRPKSWVLGIKVVGQINQERRVYADVVDALVQCAGIFLVSGKWCLDGNVDSSSPTWTRLLNQATNIDSTVPRVSPSPGLCCGPFFARITNRWQLKVLARL